VVIAGLDAAIHDTRHASGAAAWMRGTSPRMTSQSRSHRLIAVLALILLLLVPWALPIHLVTICTELLIFGLFAMSLDLLVGYTGLYSFGHAAPFAVGAYVAALALLNLPVPLPVAILMGATAAALLAVPVGWICTRATGISFAMLTLAFAQLGYAVAYKWQSVTGGSDGLAGVPRTPGPFGFIWFATRPGFYYLVLACLAGSYLFCRSFVNSPFGSTLPAIRENERKAQSLGYDARRSKLLVFIVAALFAGLAGALYAPFAGFASPELAFWLASGQVLIMVIIGGRATLIGPILGAAVFLLLEHYLSALTRSWALVTGVIYIVFVIFAPRGLWGLTSSLAPALQARLARPQLEPRI
jgi:branched-chain amino acid transport system permease protein